ncbi:hypothetical protein PR003_g12594 [Phytophthora rubi]|uniref:Apple domain-containing protein n=1 Tax=Phytophthora rubi TaxID=129364 RepID=A0A6A4F982_9STRA|nr:hypothetical protein PR003_g12594 [Phytophthora rubi]
MRRTPWLDMAPRLLVLTALAILLCLSCVSALQPGSKTAETPPKPQQVAHSAPSAFGASDNDDCSSLTGPFCAHTGSMTFFASYMTPISPSDLKQKGRDVSRRSAATKAEDGVAKWQRKKCFFRHFSSSWMDSGGDANDLMNQQVASVDECEQLCCEHPGCQSFTFWRGRTCFLRAKSKTPRQDVDSFSGIRLI